LYILLCLHRSFYPFFDWFFWVLLWFTIGIVRQMQYMGKSRAKEIHWHQVVAICLSPLNTTVRYCVNGYQNVQ
jgi:hypothetical protein